MSCEQLAAAAETRLRGARATGQVSREHVPAAKPRSWKTTGKGWWPVKSRAGRPKMCTGQLCPPFRDPDSKEQTEK